ncbi:hypothetical protein B0T26DRAFT_757314 [Lasiosphaeria miniovina]|uniref:Uncharacterized protein n=1 Tax=Lasiosphaeria miniovina TaxID=1954250 RepID=A0AA39ZU78_9PEZI|nr:uncharacterized protein B0T26DRAFT_757314 [Lasiosphaeria miniovina]KAK0703814.1 hypothetical protein B0T26DRAFT_757314 [Lasiosphaeria miniovina]
MTERRNDTPLPVTVTFDSDVEMDEGASLSPPSADATPSPAPLPTAPAPAQAPAPLPAPGSAPRSRSWRVCTGWTVPGANTNKCDNCAKPKSQIPNLRCANCHLITYCRDCTDKIESSELSGPRGHTITPLDFDRAYPGHRERNRVRRGRIARTASTRVASTRVASTSTTRARVTTGGAAPRLPAPLPTDGAATRRPSATARGGGRPVGRGSNRLYADAPRTARPIRGMSPPVVDLTRSAPAPLALARGSAPYVEAQASGSSRLPRNPVRGPGPRISSSSAYNRSNLGHEYIPEEPARPPRAPGNGYISEEPVSSPRAPGTGIGPSRVRFSGEPVVYFQNPRDNRDYVARQNAASFQPAGTQSPRSGRTALPDNRRRHEPVAQDNPFGDVEEEDDLYGDDDVEQPRDVIIRRGHDLRGEDFQQFLEADEEHEKLERELKAFKKALPASLTDEYREKVVSEKKKELAHRFKHKDITGQWRVRQHQVNNRSMEYTTIRPTSKETDNDFDEAGYAHIDGKADEAYDGGEADEADIDGEADEVYDDGEVFEGDEDQDAEYDDEEA